jgi:hypothetical protein
VTLNEDMTADDDMPSAAQVEAAASGQPTHPREPHSSGIAGRLNWLRAALGANDGIVSVAGIVFGAVVYIRRLAADAALLLPPTALRVPLTFGAVLVALALTGALSARDARCGPPHARSGLAGELDILAPGPGHGAARDHGYRALCVAQHGIGDRTQAH